MCRPCPHLFQAEGHLSLHVLQGRLGCLVLVNQFVPGFLQLLEQLLRPGLKLKTASYSRLDWSW